MRLVNFGIQMKTRSLPLFAVLAATAGMPASSSAQEPSAWIKLCDPAGGKTGQEQAVSCRVYHQRLDSSTGGVIVSVAINANGGLKTPIVIAVPGTMAKPPGTRFAVYSKEMWAQAKRGERVDDKKLTPVSIPFKRCDTTACIASGTVPASFLKDMLAGGGIMVLAMNKQGQPIGFPVPLDGFSTTVAGQPVDVANGHHGYIYLRHALIEEPAVGRTSPDRNGPQPK